MGKVENLRLGTLDWRHKSWEGEYYPEDMPEEWQLDYYSNQFQCVLLPMAAWLNLSEADVEDWVDDLEGEAFEIYLLLSLPAEESVALDSMLAQLLRLSKLLEGRLAGLLIEQAYLIQYPDLWSRLVELDVRLTVFCPSEETNRSLVSSSLSSLSPWQFEYANACFYGSPVVWLKQSSFDVAEQKQLLQSLLNTEGLVNPRLFLGEGAIDMKWLAEMQTLSELLGG